MLAMIHGCGGETGASYGRARLQHIVVDSSGPEDVWGKSIGDLNGDGRPDLIAAGRSSGGLVWYENPSWRKHVIAKDGSFSTDHEVADINGDGRNDVVSLMYDRLVWFRGGDWAPSVIEVRKLHDIEVADFDGDGRPDIVARNQSAFGGAGDKLYLYYQTPAGDWVRRVLDAPHGEGLKVTDADRDGRPDIVVNGQWYRNPGAREAVWPAYRYTTTWVWPHAYIDAHDMNGDGRPDVVLSPSERLGQRYRISWFEAPADPTREWIEHVVDPDAAAIHHFVGAADMDRDGRVDIVSAEMAQGDGPHEVKIYFNLGDHRWSKDVVAASGSHSMRLVDVDGDGSIDLFGVNEGGPHQPVELWMNKVCAGVFADRRWRRHVIDERRPWRAPFVAAADLDGDGNVDVASGAWWYRNPGRAVGDWERRAFGAPANNLAVLADLDGDGDIDVLATQGRGSDANARFAWAENDGRGNFNVHANIPDGAGDFLQGVAVHRFTDRERLQIALSWHAAGHGIQLITIPQSPATQRWKWARIADFSQDEALSAGDIDRDGKVDLLLGTRWLRNEGSAWRGYVIDPTSASPDRNRLADINRDGKPDAIIGFEAISKLGDVVWYEQGADATALWQRHRIGSAIGPMSLDVADIDGDGDLDVIVGEHNLKDPASARLLIFENVDGRGEQWRELIVYTGDEHHDGALAVDLDGDGDLDIVSIGWGHDRVVWYENPAPRCGTKR